MYEFLEIPPSEGFQKFSPKTTILHRKKKQSLLALYIAPFALLSKMD